MTLSQTQQDVLSILKKSEHILVLPSSPLDGDSLGSALSFYLALKKLGKKVTVVAEEAIPASYNFLPEIASINRELKFIRDFVVTIQCDDAANCSVRHEIQGDKINIIVTPKKGQISKEHVGFEQGKSPYDCVVTVDTADPLQLGKIYENFTELFHLVPVINIDHHASNLGFGKINHVDVMASATTMLVLPLIEELGAQAKKPLMDADIATLLLAGLITDTGSFQNPNTTPDAFAIAAKLIGYGARQQEIIRNIYKTKKLSTLRLWGRTLTKIQYDEKHRLVWSVLNAKDFTEIGSSPNESEGVIDELMSNAPGSEIIFLLKEKSPTEVSGSIRTLTSTIDASKLAGFFGGGGHVQAAGFKTAGKSVAQVETEVVAKLREYQRARLRLPEEVSEEVAAPAVALAEPKTPAAISVVPVSVTPISAASAPGAQVPTPTLAVLPPVKRESASPLSPLSGTATSPMPFSTPMSSHTGTPVQAQSIPVNSTQNSPTPKTTQPVESETYRRTGAPVQESPKSTSLVEQTIPPPAPLGTGTLPGQSLPPAIPFATQPSMTSAAQNPPASASGSTTFPIPPGLV